MEKTGQALDVRQQVRVLLPCNTWRRSFGVARQSRRVVNVQGANIDHGAVIGVFGLPERRSRLLLDVLVEGLAPPAFVAMTHIG